MADPDQDVTPYADEAQVSPAYAQAVAVLHSKNIMVPADGYFRPKEGMTRADAAQVFYRFMHSDGDYTSHVQIETQVMKLSMPNTVRYWLISKEGRCTGITMSWFSHQRKPEQVLNETDCRRCVEA